MIRPKENAPTPASLATDGNQGESAKAGGPCEAKHTRQRSAALFLALSAIDAAREQLERYGLVTDEPAPGTPEAADLLDAAAHLLMQVADLADAIESDCPYTEFSDAIKGARGGEA